MDTDELLVLKELLLSVLRNSPNRIEKPVVAQRRSKCTINLTPTTKMFAQKINEPGFNYSIIEIPIDLVTIIFAENDFDSPYKNTVTSFFF